MKKLILGLMLLSLSGCAVQPVPVTQKFPEADPVMLEPAPKLVPLPPGTTELDKLISNTAENYGLYYETVRRLELWQSWYKRQREIFDSTK